MGTWHLKRAYNEDGAVFSQVSNFNPRVKKSLFELFDRSQYDISMKFEKEVEVELGKSVDELFESYEKWPFASGSLGQVLKQQPKTEKWLLLR